MMELILESLENIVGKEENDGFHHSIIFFFSHNVFKSLFVLRVLITRGKELKRGH